MNERNLAASVRARLLNRAKETGQDFNLVLTRYAIERLLYRLSISPHADQFLRIFRNDIDVFLGYKDTNNFETGSSIWNT